MTSQGTKMVRCLLAATAIAFAGQRCILAQDEISRDLRKALEANAAALSPLTVTWERIRKSSLPDAQVLTIIGLPDTAREFMGPERVRFMWQGNKFYRYIWRHMPQVTEDGTVQTDKPLLVQEQETSFDLEAHYNGNPNRRLGAKIGDAIIIIDPTAKLLKEKGTEKICIADYLYAAGFRMPATAEQLTSGAPKTLLLEFLQQGGKFIQATVEEIDGDSCTAVELTKDGQRHRFVLDPERGYTLRRRMVWYESGQLEARIDCLDLIKLENPDHWLPRRIEIERYHPKAFPDRPLIEETITVTEMHNDPIPPEQFVLTYTEPGTRVADGTLPGADSQPSGRVSYTVPANPEDLDEVIRTAIEGPKGRRTPWFVLGANLVILAVVVTFLLLRRRWKGA